MGDFGVIYGYMLIFAFCLGGAVGCGSMYYIFKHKDDEEDK